MASLASGSKIYIGGLASSVSEHDLVQLFGKYGKITKLDFLFNKATGCPASFAYIEYESQEQGAAAIAELNNKLVRGARIRVEFAKATKLDTSNSGGRVKKHRVKATTLSLQKQRPPSESTTDKIKALEAKLASMERAEQDEGIGTSLPDIDHQAAGLPEKPRPAKLSKKSNETSKSA